MFSEKHYNPMKLEEGHSVTNVHFPKTACTVFLNTFQPTDVFCDTIELTAPLFTDTSWMFPNQRVSIWFVASIGEILDLIRSCPAKMCLQTNWI